MAEIVVRSWGSYDPDGNFIIGETVLKPYRLPVVTSQQKIDTYLQLVSTKFHL